MEISINLQKILRTGDLIINKETGIKGKIHYLVELDNQLTFESEVRFLKAIQFDNGKEIETIPISQVELTKKEK